MRRIVLPAIVLALVLTACGSGRHAVAPRVTPASAVSGDPPPTVWAIRNAREHKAEREAKALLSRFVPPPGSVRTPGPRGFNNGVEQVPVGAKSVFRHVVWRVPLLASSAAAYVLAHPPRGFHYDGCDAWNTSGPRFCAAFLYSRDHFIHSLTLNVADHLVRVEASVLWFVPHVPVPAGTAEVDVHRLHVSRRVTDPVKVARIVRWLDGLPVMPDVLMSCPLIRPRRPALLELVFRAANGKRLASASAPPYASVCTGPISFGIEGTRRGWLLVDRPGWPGFAAHVEKLLGMKS